MSENLIARNVSFTRVTNMEFNVLYCSVPVGTVKQLVENGERVWQVNEDPATVAETRLDAAVKFLVAMNLFVS